MLTAWTKHSRQYGVGLIEVLIAILVLSLGFLAAGRMQISSMRSNQDALQSTQALRLASDMMDSMRNNPVGVSSGSYDEKTTGTLTLPPCASSTCSATDVAALDLFNWSANFQDLRSAGSDFVPLLPGADAANPASGLISAPSADGTYTITVTWQGAENGVSTERSTAIVFQP